ncbi:hypothetical protein J3R30DRAFT_1792582 [Lentinula aciculospora]|uniref:Uncharacterized protein n=1 Tax=Lentinula aciculospora TaxID=153920 RepID=A0A9W9DS44_9AGAR|nr:hypothetical protein J3R30DRAFT_1792582 [Lentinula aciculospora]
MTSAHNFSLNKIDREGSSTSLLRISRSDKSESLTNSLDPGALMDSLPQLSETLHRVNGIPTPRIPSSLDSDAPKSFLNKRKRTVSNISATDKVQWWQAIQKGVDVEDPGKTVTEDESPNKRLRSMAPPPSPTDFLKHQQSMLDTPSNEDFDRPSQKHVRVILRKLRVFPNARIRMNHQLAETREMLKIAETVHEQTQSKLTEMQWTRYIVEEDVLRRQKADRTLVDGTEKLGSSSSQARKWRSWLRENTVIHR